jgi:hypothetical protein
MGRRAHDKAAADDLSGAEYLASIYGTEKGIGFF